MLIEIVEHVYLGDRQTSRNRILLQKKGIVGILSIGCEPAFSSDFSYHRVRLEDAGDLLPVLDTATEFIQTHVMQGKNVLVHCRGGRRRSPAVIVAYLAKFHHMPVQDAIQKVQTHRPCVSIPFTFTEAIRVWLSLP